MSQDSTLVYESKVKIKWLSVSHQTFMQRDKEQMAQVIVEGTSWQGHQCCFFNFESWKNTWCNTFRYYTLSQFSRQRTTSKVADTWNLRVDCKIDRNFCYLFPGEKRCTGMENMELTTIDKIEMANFCFFYR